MTPRRVGIGSLVGTALPPATRQNIKSLDGATDWQLAGIQVGEPQGPSLADLTHWYLSLTVLPVAQLPAQGAQRRTRIEWSSPATRASAAVRALRQDERVAPYTSRSLDRMPDSG
jgi:hypothetical protein